MDRLIVVIIFVLLSTVVIGGIVQWNLVKENKKLRAERVKLKENISKSIEIIKDIKEECKLEKNRNQMKELGK